MLLLINQTRTANGRERGDFHSSSTVGAKLLGTGIPVSDQKNLHVWESKLIIIFYVYIKIKVKKNVQFVYRFSLPSGFVNTEENVFCFLFQFSDPGIAEFMNIYIQTA